ncbi:F-box protein At5g52880 [Musa acuminata AAA Group]|uniref:F-box protein At5g52880 n=1 Tax=Musa acuminata AAA Group TaxID=214697 RepID=UPI0031E44826
MGRATVRERYEKLGLVEALSRAHDYPSACHELGLILRLAYADLPKNLQSVVFQETLSAFRLLPEVQTGHGLSSANVLLQAAEVALPKQKKALAVSEFKHAAVAHKRRSRAHHDGGSVVLPYDLLVHIFSFLDLRSLASVGLVCWAWNTAAIDNGLWQMLYSNLFGNYSTCTSKEQDHKLVPDGKDVVFHGGMGVDPTININWKEAVRRKCEGVSSWKFLPNRVVCGHCQSIIWSSGITCRTSHECSKIGNQKLNIRPISPCKVVEYLLGEIELAVMSSDTDDSDSDGPSPSTQHLPRLWAYPKLSSTS